MLTRTLIWLSFSGSVILGQSSLDSQKSASISGTVVGAVCGQGIARAGLRLMQVGSDQTTRETQTGAEGDFVFASLAPGVYDIHVKAAGYKPASIQANATTDSVSVELDGEVLCPSGAPPIRYVKSALPQELEFPHDQVFADDFANFARLTSICEIALNPSLFKGRMVSVRGLVHLDFEAFLLSAKDCSQRTADDIWLEYGSGPKRQPTIWCCGDLTPSDSLKLVQNAEFEAFDRDLTARWACRGGSCNQYEVTATLTGRIDYQQGGGFGHFGVSSVRLVISQVAKVSAKRVRGRQ